MIRILQHWCYNIQAEDKVRNDIYDIIWRAMKQERGEYFEHTSTDYPVGVYYVDLHRMYLNCVLPNTHEEMEICLMREGSASFLAGGESFTLSEGEAVWLNSGRIHSITNTDEKKPCILLSILFHPSYLFDNDTSFLAVKYLTPIMGDSSLSHIILRSSEEYGRHGLECINEILEINLDRAYGYELKTKGLLCALWMHLLEKSSMDSSNTERVNQNLMDEARVSLCLNYISKNFRKKLTLEDIAGSIHVSKSECCRTFKRCTGMTPFDCLLHRRIYEAARRLQRQEKNTDTMQKLSSYVGFSSASYFNKVFKSHLGCTPIEYRSIIKKSHRDALNPYGIPLSRL